MATQKVMYLLGPERVELRDDPVQRPGPGEMLVRIDAATTCGTDVKVYRRGGHPRMLRAPTPFGHELAGTVVEAGAEVEGFRGGDRVVVVNSAACGACGPCLAGRENLCEDLQYLNGAFAEHILVPRRFVERSTYRLPDDLPSEIAALTEPLACVIHGIEACGLSAPADVVLYGAGPIGLLFTGALAAEGHEVTVCDLAASRLDAAARMGASRTLRLEPEMKDVAGAVRALSPGERGFSVAIDATGVGSVWSEAIGSARPGGLVNLFGGCAPGTVVPLDAHLLHYGELTIRGVYHHRPATVRRSLDLLAARVFPADILLSAERRLEDLAEALQMMIRKEALKVVIRS
ncbi:MAG: alcohol dehydrogenase catalytic domain-containing protein [Planctomycetes bacterium]|nr:alcohol dehydrogenase catalytic domain-containing protein [Planctomycetota bacterium]